MNEDLKLQREFKNIGANQ